MTREYEVEVQCEIKLPIRFTAFLNITASGKSAAKSVARTCLTKSNWQGRGGYTWDAEIDEVNADGLKEYSTTAQAEIAECLMELLKNGRLKAKVVSVGDPQEQ